MADLMFHLGSALAMLIVIGFSFYMVRNTKGRMSEGFKIMLVGHVPLMLLHLFQAVWMISGRGEPSDLKMAFLDETAQVIAAFSIFIAIYLIRNTLFMMPGETKDES